MILSKRGVIRLELDERERRKAFRRLTKGDKVFLKDQEAFDNHYDTQPDMKENYPSRIVTIDKTWWLDEDDPRGYSFSIEEDDGVWSWYLDLIDIL